MTTTLPARVVNRSLRFLCLLVASEVATTSVPAQFADRPEPIWIRTTNFLPRFITNIIKVSIPTNRFYDECRTNWVRQRITNVVDLFCTNIVPVVEFRTNLQIAYTTNLTTITLTNWVNVPVTNAVEIEIPIAKTESAPVTTPPPPPAKTASKAEPQQPVASNVDNSTRLEFELTHTAKPTKPDQYPVRLVLKAGDAADTILPVQEWRVDKVDGGAFMIGSRAEFTGTLPAGSYRVSARLRAGDNPLRNVGCQIDVKSDGSAQRSPGLPATR